MQEIVPMAAMLQRKALGVWLPGSGATTDGCAGRDGNARQPSC
jgi:hypothetical protein